MAIHDISYLTGKRELIALGVLVCVFAALLAFQLAVWSFVAVAVLFIAYASWTTTAFLAQQPISGSSLTACAWPVSIATVQALVGLGLGWLIVWSAHHVFGV